MTVLQFVGPEEAAKWPEGQRTQVVALQAHASLGGRVVPYCFEITTPGTVLAYWRCGYTHFARLPDLLPEIER